MNPVDLVRNGYDRLGEAYHSHFAPLHAVEYPEWIRLFTGLVSPGARVLDLGCAGGGGVATALAGEYFYQGIDLSPVQIAIARREVPKAEFRVADMTTLQFPAGSLGGVIALYSIIHVPLEKQPKLLREIFNWLNPGGIFMTTLGAGEWTGTEVDWVVPGTRMYWSHASADEYDRWLREIGFEILDQRIVPEGKARHAFILARKPNFAGSRS